jgi:HK97 family phage major capsid protein/HK97 family phage prohead protease
MDLDTRGDEVEVRSLEGLRAEGASPTPTLAGHAVVTGVPSLDLGGFQEVITAEALRRALAADPDIVCLRNHDAMHVLGRQSAGTLTTHQDERGLAFRVTLPSHEAHLAESVTRGDLRHASFAFYSAQDGWNEHTTPPTRIIHDFRLREISVGVAFPAYPATLVTALRSLDRHRAATKEQPPMPETPPVLEPEPQPPVPPVVTTRSVPDVETRILGRGDSFRSWVEERSRHPKEFGHVRLGDVLRAMITGPRTDLEKRVLSEGTDSAGGYTVPDILLAQWIDRLRNALVVVQAGATTVPLTSDVTKIARLLTDPTAAWRAENAAVAESDPAFEAVTFAPKSLDVFFKVSRELLEDSINIAEMLEATLVRSFAVEVDRVCLYGTGTPPQPRGLRTTTNVNEVSQGTNGAAITSYDPVLDLLAMLWADNVTEVTTAIMAPRTLATLSKFKEATTNAPLARPAVLAGWRFLQTGNASITETQGGASTASTLFMGDWSQMMLGFRTQMMVEVARELYRGNYQVGYFGHLRMDMQVTHPESFGRLIGIIP